MAFMTWNDSYLTGIAPVDAQHRRLVEMIDEAAPSLATGNLSSDGETGKLLDGLIDYVATHFATEENIMRLRGIDSRHLLHHAGTHARFADQIAAIRSDLARGSVMRGMDLLRFLSNWLAYHILGEDQRMGAELNAIERGDTPETAYEATEGKKAEVLQNANDVLVAALVDMFSQLTDQNRLLSLKNDNLEAVRKELDAERQHLEREVSRRTTELREANLSLTLARDAAEAASAAKGRFLRSVSHELLTPLNAIVGFAHLLEHAEIPRKQRDQAGRIASAADHLHAQINEVLQFSRLDAGEVTLATAPFSPAALVTQIVERTAARAREKGLEINARKADRLPILIGDERLLRQALETLASNAMKFTDQGGVEIGATMTDEDAESAEIVFDVRDSGIGIPPQRQKELFLAFQQLDSTSSRRYGGVGLGLSVCARLVQLMDGTISVESTPGSGSTFRIALRLKKQAASSALQPAAGACPELDREALSDGLRRLSQLLAEDDIESRTLFRELAPGLKEQLGDDAVEKLAGHISRYEFEQAGALLATSGQNLE